MAAPEEDYALREEDIPVICEQYDKLADIVRASLDMKEIYRIIGL